MITPSRLAALVRQYGWPEGLERYAWDGETPLATQIKLEIGLRHTAWKAFLPPQPKRPALVIDGGCGSAAIALARDFPHVYAVYTDPDLRFVVQQRVSALGITNIEFLGAADFETLDLPPAACDAAAITGVPVESLRPEVVDRLRGWLSPDARVYIGLENNRQLSRFLQLRRHLRLRFGRVECFRYLSDGGLSGVYEISPLQTRRGGWKQRLLTVAAPFRDPAFGIVASVEKGSVSLLDRVLFQARRSSDSPAALQVERYCFANPYGLTLIAAGNRILRIALSVEAIERNQTNYQALCALQSNRAIDSSLVPHPVNTGCVGGSRFFVETAVPGRLASQIVGEEKSRAAVTERAIEWITRLHASTAKVQMVDEGSLHRLILEPLDRAERTLASGTLFNVKEFLVQSLAGQSLPLVFCHGDYSVDNIAVEAGARLSGVFDWDLAEPQGLPFSDVFYFLLTVARRKTGRSFGSLFASRLGSPCGDPAEERVVRNYCQALHLAEHLLAPLSLMAWIHHVGRRTHNPERYRFTPDAADIAGDALPMVERWIAGRADKVEENESR